jgi:urease accessory protein UreF
MSLAPAALLQLIWLASPALPVGGFSYSEGLEAAVDAGLADTEARAQQWLLQQLAWAGRCTGRRPGRRAGGRGGAGALISPS